MGQSFDYESFLRSGANFPPPVPSQPRSKDPLKPNGREKIESVSDFELRGDVFLDRVVIDSLPEGIILFDIERGKIVDANQAACSMHGYTRDEFIGLSPSDFLHPESFAQFTDIQESILKGETYSSVSKNMFRDGTPFVVEYIYKAFPSQTRSYMLGFFRVNDAYIQTLQEYQNHLQNRCREQSRLLEFARLISESLEFDAELVLNQMRGILPFQQAVMFRLNDDTLVPFAAYQDRSIQGLFVRSIELKNSDAFETLWIDQPSIRLDKANRDGSGHQEFEILRQCGLTAVFPDMQSQIWVPLKKKGHLHGCMGFGQSEADFYQDHHTDLALKAAGLVANALINAELHSQAQATASLEERQTLARNLHDAVNQSLFSAGLIAEVLPHVWEKNQEEGRRSLEDLRRLTRGAQAEIRMMLVELRPSALIDVEIADLLHLLANAFTGRTNIPVEENLARDITLPSHIQKAYYHFCQEALNNIVKHARATQVSLNFGKKDDSYILTIKDNGIGFDRRRKGIKRERRLIDREKRDVNAGFNPKFIPPGHYGLRMMDELASSVGATLYIDTRPGQGTSISIRWKNAPEKEESR